MNQKARYLPALGFDVLTPLYDAARHHGSVQRGEAVRRCCGVIAFALALVASAASAHPEGDIRRALEPKLGGATVESIQPAPIAGLFEVVVRTEKGLQVFYSDAKAALLVLGHIIDARSDRNLTQDRVRALTAVKWDSLPFNWAIPIRHGDGRRSIAVFSDPNCPFCRRFEQTLADLGDVTVQLFLYPIINPDSVRQSKAVWCARDRARAWMNLLFKGIEPRASPDCETPVDEIMALGRMLGADATPTWILPDGTMGSGALPAEQLRALLDRTLPAAGKKGG